MSVRFETNMKSVVFLWFLCVTVFSLDISQFIEKILNHHRNLEFNSIHSKFGLLIASKLDSQYKDILLELSRKPVFNKQELSEDVLIGKLLLNLFKRKLVKSSLSIKRTWEFGTIWYRMEIWANGENWRIFGLW